MPAWGKRKRVMWGTGDSQWGGADIIEYRDQQVDGIQEQGGDIDGDAKSFYTQSGSTLHRPRSKSRKYSQSWGTITDRGGDQWDVRETDTFSFKRHVPRDDDDDGGEEAADVPPPPRRRRRVAPAVPEVRAATRPRTAAQERELESRRQPGRAALRRGVTAADDLSPAEQRELADVIARAAVAERGDAAVAGMDAASFAFRHLLGSAPRAPPVVGPAPAPLVEEPIVGDMDWDFAGDREDLRAPSPERPRKRARVVEEVAPFDPAAARAADEEARLREEGRRARAARVAPRRSTRARSGRTYYDEEYYGPRGRGMPPEYSDSDEYSDEYSD